MIANLFERQTIGNKARRTGMTQRMRSAMGNMVRVIIEGGCRA